VERTANVGDNAVDDLDNLGAEITDVSGGQIIPN
jgi:hypothetical protein